MCRINPASKLQVGALYVSFALIAFGVAWTFRSGVIVALVIATVFAGLLGTYELRWNERRHEAVLIGKRAPVHPRWNTEIKAAMGALGGAAGSYSSSANPNRACLIGIAFLVISWLALHANARTQDNRQYARDTTDARRLL